MPASDYRYHTLDVFTDTPYSGNPLAVFPDGTGLSGGGMQRIAAELNLSETVFLFPPDDAANAARARIFTPGSELPFAGHPTIGTAVLLVWLGLVPVAVADGDVRLVLEEGVGAVQVTVRVQSGTPVAAQLTAAGRAEFRDDVPRGAALASLLAVREEDVDAAGLTPQAVSLGVPYVIAPLATRDAVSRARLRHDMWDRLLAPAWARNVYLFAAEDVRSGSAIRARMFAPELAVPEDPATGSAAVALATYLAARDHTTDGTLRWTIEQGVEMGRPSTLHIEAEKTGGTTGAVRVAGRAVRVGEGRLIVTPGASAAAAAR